VRREGSIAHDARSFQDARLKRSREGDTVLRMALRCPPSSLRAVSLFVAYALALVGVEGCAQRALPPPRCESFAHDPVVVHDWVHAASLEGNRLGDSAERSVHVYLPPSYFRAPTRRFPVVYLLHGFGGRIDGGATWVSPNEELGGARVLVDAMARGTSEGAEREFIVVMPDGSNAYGGSFYVNSDVTGRWEDFLVRDLVAYVDGRYRTIAAAPSRALVGFSMGGFGALRTAFRHPEVFGVVYGMSPAAVDDMLTGTISPKRFASVAVVQGADELARRDFLDQVAVAAAAAFTPDPAVAPLFAKLPVRREGRDGVALDAPVAAVWNGMLSSEAVAADRDRIVRLRAIGIEVGKGDELERIPATTERLHRALERAGVPHAYTVFDGGHFDRLPERMRVGALPFASKHLVFEDASRE
jgi:S-formylglutathione hydrolase